MIDPAFVTVLRRLGPASLLSVLVATSAGTLSAQDLPPIRTPTSIIPNYDRVLIGQMEALEGGAYVARTGNAGSNWYNPAGLAASEETSLNASANAYEYTTIELEGLDSKFGSGRFRSVSTFFGGVIGAPVLKGRDVRLGFSFTRPVVWSPGTVTGATRFEVGGESSAQVSYTSGVDLSTSVPALAAGFRISDRFRVGASAGMAITSLRTSQTLTSRVVDLTGLTRGFRTIYVDGQTWDLSFGAGVQWDVSEAVRLGGTVNAPGLRIAGSGIAEDQVVLGYAGNESVDLSMRDPEARFDYREPFRLVGGVAVRLGAVELEADVRHYGGRSEYALIETDSTVQVLVTDADGNLTQDRVATPDVRETARAVTNFAVGGNVPIPGGFRLHAGFFTDRSPVGTPGASIFRSIDLTGVTAGISFGGRLTGSIGVSSSWGTSEERDVDPPVGGLPTGTRISIRTFNLHYALSYRF